MLKQYLNKYEYQYINYQSYLSFSLSINLSIYLSILFIYLFLRIMDKEWLFSVLLWHYTDSLFLYLYLKTRVYSVSYCYSITIHYRNILIFTFTDC